MASVYTGIMFGVGSGMQLAVRIWSTHIILFKEHHLSQQSLHLPIHR